MHVDFAQLFLIDVLLKYTHNSDLRVYKVLTLSKIFPSLQVSLVLFFSLSTFAPNIKENDANYHDADQKRKKKKK